MELNEALRRIVIGHWRLLVMFTLLPVMVIGALQLRSAPLYTASARVQASSTPPSTTTEADAVLNRAQGIATSTTAVQKALEQAQVTDRSVANVVHEVGVSRIGTSSVLNVTVTDRDPKVATAVDSALAPQLVNLLNGSTNTSLVSQLTAQENTLLAQRTQTAAQLALAQSATATAKLAAELSTIDQQLSDLQATLRQVQSTGLGTNTATVVSLASGAVSARSSLATDLGLGALLGLVAGLLTATVLEVVRPRVADAGAFSREVGAPFLGHLVLRGGKKQPQLMVPPETLVVAKRAVAHGRIDTIVLTGPAPSGQLQLIALQLENHLTSGSTPVSAAMGRSSWNGSDPSGGGRGPSDSADGSHELDGSRELAWAGQTPVLEASPVLDPSDLALPRPVRVLALSDVDDVSDWCRHGLLVLVPDLASYSEARRIRHLIAVTGWPVIGVLGTSWSRRRAREQSRQA